MKKKVITGDMVKTLYESKFVKLYDLQYEPGKHYYDATRHSAENLIAVKSEEEFRSMVPDAVTCVVILVEEGKEPKLLLTREYRYPTGQFVLSLPAGLIDPEDQAASLPACAMTSHWRIEEDGPAERAALSAAVREIKEESGLDVNDGGRISLVTPCVFSSPGMTDESNAICCAVIRRKEAFNLSQAGAVGSELFDGFVLVTKEEAREILKKGRDAYGIFYPAYTWMGLIYFISGMWEE